MCGRFTLTVDQQALNKIMNEAFNLSVDSVNPNYNITPKQTILSVIYDGKDYRIGHLLWGFIPPWIKDKDKLFQIINTKSETIDEKKAFIKSFKSQRCLILTDGFYEWDNDKQPYYYKLKDQDVFAFAGIYTKTVFNDGETLFSTSIVTTEANALLSEIHERMPVILNPDDYQTWLNPHVTNTQRLKSLLTPFDSTKMYHYKVSKAVNNPRNNTSNLIEPIEGSTV